MTVTSGQAAWQELTDVQLGEQALQRVLQQRLGDAAAVAAVMAKVQLAVDPKYPADAFAIRSGADESLMVIAQSRIGLLHGVGRLLREGRFAEGRFEPGAWRGIDEPQCPWRGIYFAFHRNYYSFAPVEELYEYLQDLALWGINAVCLHLHQPTPAADNYQEEKSRNRAIVAAARRLGMKVGLLKCTNMLNQPVPEELRSVPVPDTEPATRGQLGPSGVCPSKPEGFRLLSEMLHEYLQGYEGVGIDFVMSFPYDAGGCGCELCWPWGARGYITIAKEFSRLAKSMYPGCQFILPTWCFDCREESDGEWEGLTQLLAKQEDRAWVDGLMVDAHGDFPRFPLEQGAPGGLPMVNFAEISMFGRFPWGGNGANPMPARYQRIWDQSGHALAGGFPYSEGCFEDINKVIFARFYWDRSSTAGAAVRQYVAFYFGPQVVDLVAQAIELLEKTYPAATREGADVVRAYELLEQAEAKMAQGARRSWRWRILKLRSVIDYEKLMHDNQVTDRCDAALEELIEIFRLQQGWHCVTPPSRSARARRQREQETAAALPPGAVQ